MRQFTIIASIFAAAPAVGLVSGACGDAFAATLLAGDAHQIINGGTAVTLVVGTTTLGGCYVTNPLSAADEGVAASENAYVDPVTTAGTTGSNGTTSTLAPGQTYSCVPGQTNNLTGNAATSGHTLVVVKW